MTASRFTSIGFSGRKDQVSNRSDAFKQIIEIPITLVASGAEQSTGVTLPTRCVVTSTIVNVFTAEATGTTTTIDVGLLAGGGADLADDVSVAATGFVAGISDVVGSGDEVTYTLGSADYAELDAVILLEITAAD